MSRDIRSVLRAWKRLHEESIRLEVEGRVQQSIRPKRLRLDHVPVNNRAGSAAHEGGFNEVPTLFLESFPADASEIAGINGGRQTPLIRLLAEPPALRRSGFDLSCDGEVHIVREGLRRSCVRGDVLLELHRDGTLIYLARADDLLCRLAARHADAADPLRINPLALAETVYNFVELSRQLSEYLQPRPTGYGFDLGMWRMSRDGRHASLGPGSLRDRSYDRLRGFNSAPQDNHVIRLDWFHDVVNVGAVTFRLLEHLYAWFRITSDGVPYCADDAGGRTLDPGLLKRDW